MAVGERGAEFLVNGLGAASKAKCGTPGESGKRPTIVSDKSPGQYVLQPERAHSNVLKAWCRPGPGKFGDKV